VCARRRERTVRRGHRCSGGRPQAPEPDCGPRTQIACNAITTNECRRQRVHGPAGAGFLRAMHDPVTCGADAESAQVKSASAKQQRRYPEPQDVRKTRIESLPLYIWPAIGRHTGRVETDERNPYRPPSLHRWIHRRSVYHHEGRSTRVRQQLFLLSVALGTWWCTESWLDARRRPTASSLPSGS
jgi:hypothetical protein